MISFSRRTALVLLFLLAALPTAVGQDMAPSESVLPADPASWINAPPISTEMLAGKAAVFWFFEET